MPLTTTKGIVLHQVKYGDTSVICHVYTLHYGRLSFIFKGIRAKKSRIHSNILQSLFIINIEAYIKEGKDLFLAKEASPEKIFSGFPYDNNKRAQAIFLSDILNICLREPVSDERLFTFLKNSIEYFDLMTTGSTNFHLLFMIKLSKYLGFYPANKYHPGDFVFDLKDGIYKDHFPDHTDYLNPDYSDLLEEILQKNFDQLSGLQLNQRVRNELLDFLLKFYSLHVEGIARIRSHLVLRELFV